MRYVGLVTGACLAHTGHRVLCGDARRGAEIGEGRAPFYEPGLGKLVERMMRRGCLSFSTGLAPVERRAGAFFVASGTPQGEDGVAGLPYRRFEHGR